MADDDQSDQNSDDSQPQQAPDGFVRIVRDGSEAVGFLKGAYGLAKQVITDVNNIPYMQKKKLDALLGEWATAAYEDKDHSRCLSPVLPSNETFLDFVSADDGILAPQGSCAAKASWASFLHALAIGTQPAMLEWKPQLRLPKLEEQPAIALEITGAMLGHIVNLYRTEPDRHIRNVEVKQRLESRQTCTLSFGELSWRNVQQITVITFRKGDVHRQLNVRKLPFGDTGALFDPGVRIAAYLNAFHYPWVSDVRLAWPTDGATLRELAQALLSRLDELGRRGSAADPLLLTHTWLRTATQIRNKVLRNGSQRDESLLRDLLRAAGTRYPPGTGNPLTPQLDPSIQVPRYIENHMKRSADEPFRYVMWKEPPRPAGAPLPQNTPQRDWSVEAGLVVDDVLNGYFGYPTESWQFRLSRMGEEVKRIVQMSSDVPLVYGRTRVLDYTDNDDIWNGIAVVLP